MQDNNNIQGYDELHATLAALADYLKEDLADRVGIEAVNWVKENFQRESFGAGGQKWASRKTIREGNTNGQKVLSKSGELGDSPRYEVKGNQVIIAIDKPYAELHNEGGELVVTEKMRRFFWAKHKEAKDAGLLDMADQWKGMALAKKLTFPQRQFIGENAELFELIESKIEADLNKIVHGS